MSASLDEAAAAGRLSVARSPDPGARPRPIPPARRRPAPARPGRPTDRRGGRPGRRRSRPASGSTHRNEPDRPKWPKVRGELAVPVQCGRLSPRISTPRPQSHGSNRPKPGSTPARPANWTEVASAWVAALTRVGTASSRPSASRSPSGPARARRRRPCAVGGSRTVSPIHSGSSTASAQVVGEGDARPLRHQVGQQSGSRRWSRYGWSPAGPGAGPARDPAPRRGPAGGGRSTPGARPARRGPAYPPRRRPERPGRWPAWSPTPTERTRSAGPTDLRHCRRPASAGPTTGRWPPRPPRPRPPANRPPGPVHPCRASVEEGAAPTSWLACTGMVGSGRGGRVMTGRRARVGRLRRAGTARPVGDGRGAVAVTLTACGSSTDGLGPRAGGHPPAHRHRQRDPGRPTHHRR